MWLQDNSKFIPVENPNLAKKRTAPDIAGVSARTNNFGTIEDTYTPHQAAEEAARCLKCPTHWCQKKCPAGVPVTDFIALTRAGRYEDAYRLIRTASMLPEFCSRVCPQELQCQSDCTRSIQSQAVGVGKLERYVVEQHYASGIPEPCTQATGKSIAVVGSGPAGLSAAQRLADLGHSVTVYERSDRIGGLLQYGIPNMKISKDLIERKTASMRAQGVNFILNADIGASVSERHLLEQYDAVILAVGTGNARRLNLNGADNVSGIIHAVDFLSDATKAVLQQTPVPWLKGKQVVIVGGGDTGNDCVGTAIRLGCSGITQIEMMPKQYGHQWLYEIHPGREKEKKHDFSQEECSQIFGDPHVWQTTVKAVRADNVGRIKEVQTVSLAADYDSHFNLHLTEIPGSEHWIPCDFLIVAAGFIGPESYVADAFALETDGRTNFLSDNHFAHTQIFVCGDCRTGQSLVVKAMADGRDCADCVDDWLNK